MTQMTWIYSIFERLRALADTYGQSLRLPVILSGCWFMLIQVKPEVHCH